MDPKDIKVTSKSPTLEELKEYRADWLKEAEEAGKIDDLFKIIHSLGIRGNVMEGIARLHDPYYRVEFDVGELPYVILYKRYWSVPAKNGSPGKFDQLYVVEGGKYMHEAMHGNKRLVSYFRGNRYSLQDTEHNNPLETPPDAKEIMINNFYVPGDWELYIGALLELVNANLGEASTNDYETERKTLLHDLCYDLKTS